MSRMQFEALLLKRPNALGVLFGAASILTILLLSEGMSIIAGLMGSSVSQPFVQHLLMPILTGALLSAFVMAMLTPWRMLNPVNGKTLLRSSNLHQSSAWGFRIGFVIGIFAGGIMLSIASYLVNA